MRDTFLHCEEFHIKPFIKVSTVSCSWMSVNQQARRQDIAHSINVLANNEDSDLTVVRGNILQCSKMTLCQRLVLIV